MMPNTRRTMSWPRAAVTVASIAALLSGPVWAIAPTLRDQDIERALKLAQANDDKRAQFHAPYIVQVDDATLERVEVVTEFRRYVLTTEEQLRLGRWLFAQTIKDAQQLLRPWRGRVSLLARIRFHPQNTLRVVPPYEVHLGAPDVAPLDLVRTPITAMHSGKSKDFFAPLMGATIEAVFEAAAVGQGARPVRLVLGAEDVARATIDFAKLE